MGPTLCFRAKTGVRLAAFIDILISLAMLTVSVGCIYYLETYPQQVLDFLAQPPDYITQFVDVTSLGHNTVRVLLGFNTVYWIQKTYLGWLADRAAANESPSKCKIWLVYTFGLLILSVTFFLASIIAQVVKPWGIPFYIACFIVREYSIWIVVRFKSQLEQSGAGLSARLMDAKDITVF